MRPGRGSAVAVALVLDALFGEPLERWHPVVWMGRAISAFEVRALRLDGPLVRRLAGITLAVVLPAAIFASTRGLLGIVPGRLRWPLETALISTTLSMRGLGSAAKTVETTLRAEDLPASRAGVGRFVGRDTADLSGPEVARAAVESVAENTSDGVIAPMMYGALFGAPGALAYKAVNTLDSMVGYPEPPYSELGWASARLDDLANLLPARMTVVAAAVCSGRPVSVVGGVLRYGPRTRSPNAGRTEAAFAGALDVRLGGANSYGGALRGGPVLGDGRPPGAKDIRRSVNLMRRCCALLALATLVAERVIYRG